MKFSVPYCSRCEREVVHSGMDAIWVEDLEVGYEKGAAVLENLSFKVQQGMRVALLGPNGAGKSTLLQAMVGILRPRKGFVKIFEHELDSCLHDVTYLPQRSQLDWEFPVTVEKLVLTGSYIHMGWFSSPSKEYKKRAKKIMEDLGLYEVRKRQIRELSVGQQQRALLARALVHDAEVFILDEPYNAVDIETQEVMRGRFKELKEAGKTLLIATHHRERLDEDYDGALYMESGKLIKEEVF